MNFGQAIEELKKGALISRSGWNGKGMFVYLVPSGSYPAQTGVAKAYFGDSLVPYAPYLAIKNVDNTVSTWAPSVGDTLAEDWSFGLRASASLDLADTTVKLAIVDKEFIARAAHEVNRAYCAALGDATQVAWENAPEWQRSSARMGVELHTSNPDASPSASHESWMAQKVSEGWVYGAYKDTVNKTHPCMLPFDQLSPEQRAKDFLFKAVVNVLTPL